MDGLLTLDPGQIALAALAIALIGCMVAVVLAVRQSRLLARYRMLLSGPANQNLESVLLALGARVDQHDGDLQKLLKRVGHLEQDALSHIQKAAIVRFSAFPDIGSDLSFAIALLDAQDTGIVISSLYGRSESRTYAKPIQRGTSTYALSQEEKDAIQIAINQTLKVRAARG